MSGDSASLSTNWILGRLTEPEHRSFLARLQLVPLRFNDVIYEAGDPLKQVYFPIRGALSALAMMEGGDGIEIASIGKEGLVGCSTCNEATHSPYKVIVQSAGEAYRLEAAVMQEELKLNPTLRRLLELSQATFLAAVSQTAACNGLHTVMQRCCRWLLTSCDRLESNELPHTHEFLALMLGVRRPSVTDVLQPLQQQEIIRHSRGRITIVDHRALEERACECYRTTKENRRRLLEKFPSGERDGFAGAHAFNPAS
ncbi:MAG: Crp/Fnr family transcriptional regulator [Planctomycetia bacterium]|nr:Crp/Fnr family transcriptional regulator [Planctomycetia bacterium]